MPVCIQSENFREDVLPSSVKHCNCGQPTNADSTNVAPVIGNSLVSTTANDQNVPTQNENVPNARKGERNQHISSTLHHSTFTVQKD
jgi:hypothetical protein